jgi:hypothetical protein
MNNNKWNTARAPNIKHDSPEVKDVCYFADRFWYVLELKKKKLKPLYRILTIIMMLIWQL